MVCNICGSEKIMELLSLGRQPVCNRFFKKQDAKEYTHNMAVAQCKSCGAIVLIDPVPSAELLPRYPWISYQEPEGHLDELVETIIHLPGLTKESAFCGISFKDDSTLARIQERGFKKVHRLDFIRDLAISQACAGVETIQACLTPERAKAIAEKNGRADVLVVRHILEHAYIASSFINALKEIVKKEGYIIFEVPDCSNALKNYDYTTLWEEHMVYFTPLTFRNTFLFNRLSLEYFKRFEYPFENSLVAITKPLGMLANSETCEEKELQEELIRAEIFFQEFPLRKKRIAQYISEYKRNNGNIAFFGAGHLACVYINFFGLKDFIEFVIDGNPNKKGLLMPGSHLPIVSSEALKPQDVRLCLLALNPINEAKVLADNNNFLLNGGKFLSIFPASRIALNLEDIPV